MYTDAIVGNQFGMLSDSQLQSIFSFLKQHNIALAVEFGPLTPSGCGVGVEGFGGPAAQALVNRIKANGGTLSYLAMDEPFYFANIYTGTGACQWSAQQIATNALQSLNVLKAGFPDLVIGDIEPLSGNGKAPDWLDRYTTWMDAFEAATGSKLAFFDSDTILSIPSWMSDLVSLRAQVRRRGIPLGIIYNGFATDTSDEQWTTNAQKFFTEFELSNGQPDQAIFQSWEAFPMHYLPETAPYTFTWLIDQYTLPRPDLSLKVSDAQATGKLLDAQGNGIASAQIGITAQPILGAGIVATYTLTGVVPATISAAVIQICVNLCGSQGTNNMSVYSFHYADSGNQESFDFSKGLAGWGIDGNGTATVEAGLDANGPFLSVSATAAQSTLINSPSVFAVTPGSAYTLTVTARISPASVGSGYFALIFGADPSCATPCPVTSAFQETSRDTLLFAPGTVTLGTAQTASDGSYGIQFSPMDVEGMVSEAERTIFKPEGTLFEVIADYPGSVKLWPAQATVRTECLQSSPCGR